MERKTRILAADVAAVRALIGAPGFLGEREIASAVELARASLEEKAAAGYEFIRLEADGVAMGFACFGRLAGTAASYELYGIAVQQRMRGSGYGRRLLAAAEARIAEQGGQRVYVEISGRAEYAKTRRFHQLSGYAFASVFEDFYAVGEAKVCFVKVLGAKPRAGSLPSRPRALPPSEADGAPSRLRLNLLPQPNDTTCGPTCLHAVYRYFRDRLPLEDLIREVEPLADGGTLAVTLACHALRRGYQATIYTYNLQLFDPTWFFEEMDLSECLRAQATVKPDAKLQVATRMYLEFLSLGGILRYDELRPELIFEHLQREVPILTGLSATYLYDCTREQNDADDPIGGEPVGHFVLLSGYDPVKREVFVADPMADNPGFQSQYYSVGIDRLLGAMMLGIVTYDANLLLIEPGGG